MQLQLHSSANQLAETLLLIMRAANCKRPSTMWSLLLLTAYLGARVSIVGQPPSQIHSLCDFEYLPAQIVSVYVRVSDGFSRQKALFGETIDNSIFSVWFVHSFIQSINHSIICFQTVTSWLRICVCVPLDSSKPRQPQRTQSTGALRAAQLLSFTGRHK